MNESLSAFVQFATFDQATLAQLLSLLILPFAHEDLAIVLGGYIVVNNVMPLGLVALAIYVGMVASDFALYGIGSAARHLPWLRRIAIDGRVSRFGETLQRNMFGLMALCRVVPGVVFVAFVACGWTRVPLSRFTVASLVVSALYLPLILTLVIVFGDALDDRAGLWAWPMLLVALCLVAFVRRQVFSFGRPADAASVDPASATDETVETTSRLGRTSPQRFARPAPVAYLASRAGPRAFLRRARWARLL